MRRLVDLRTLGLAITGVVLLASTPLFFGCGGSTRRVVAEDRISQLKRDVRKVDFAVQTTKTLIARARDAEYLPDLYNRLSELYVEQARYHYLIAAERQKGQSAGVTSVQASLLKNQAVSTYKRLLAAFPDYPDADKVTFFMGHELRELGEYDQMLQTYQTLADKYPKSEYRLEGLLVMGDYYFDKAELDRAESYYQKILDSPESRVHAMARYKLAWCKVNKAEYKAALKLFEGSIEAAKRFHTGDPDSREKKGGKIDLRREALVDSVFCYTEVNKPNVALPYFRSRADSKTTYLAALDKLANRYYVKQNWKATGMVYREILSLTGDTEDSVEYSHRLYESIRNGRDYANGAEDVRAFVRVIRRRYFNHTLSDKDRQALHDTFEKYTRDVATRLHDLANQKQSRSHYLAAAKAYQAYLSFYSGHKNSVLVQTNLAEVLYAAKRYIRAADTYFAISGKLEEKERKDAIYTAIASYYAALTGERRLRRLELETARAGLRQAGEVYIRDYGKEKNVKEVKFNIARTYYDAGQFDEAIRLFRALVDEFPRDKEATIAAHLVLDAYRTKEDYEGLIAAGRAFLSINGLADSRFRSEVTDIIKGAEENLLRSETIRAGDAESSGIEKLEELAETHRGTNLGKRALINAFVTARNAKDPEKMFEFGDKLIAGYPNDEEVPGVLSTMGKVALDSLQFARGATYLEEAAKRKRGADAIQLYQAAVQIRVRLGDREKAEEDLNKLLRLGISAEEKAQIAVNVARLHIQADDWGSVIRLLRSASRAGASSAELAYLLGYGLYRQDDLGAAERHLVQAIRLGSGGSDSDREAAAAAQFYSAEIAFKAFSAVQLSNDLNQLGSTLQQKIGLLAQTRESYTNVVSLRSAGWSVAALARLASVDIEAAQALRTLSFPPDLPAEVITEVKGALTAQAAPLETEAKEAIDQCATTARKFKVLSAAAKACLAGQPASGDPQAEKRRPASRSSKQPEGATTLQKQLASNPKDQKAIHQLGRLYLNAGDPYMARMILGKGLEIEETPENINLIGVATARLGDHQEALDLFAKAIKLDKRYTFARVNTAALLLQFGHVKAGKKEAARIQNRIGALDSSDVALLPNALTLIRGGAR